MTTWKLALRYAPLLLRWYSKHKGEFKLPKANFSAALGRPDDETANWESLANHLQAKVRQRTAEVSRLHTKAGFIILTIAILLQPVITLRFESTVVAYVAAISLMLSLLFALATLYMGKTRSALRPANMVGYLTEHPDASKLEFQRWLAKAYTAAYTQLDETYDKTETMLKYSTGLLLLSFILTLASKLAS